MEKYPGDAIVYVEADIGQCSERASCIDFATYEGNAPHYGDELPWSDPEIEPRPKEEATVIKIW